MSRDCGSGPAHMRLAFYGPTNHTGDRAGTDMFRQYRDCLATATEFGAMTQWFYDAPHALDGDICEVEFQLGAPVGDCRDLAIKIAAPDRESDAIACATLDRLPCQPRLRHPLLRAARNASTPFMFADDELSLNRQLVSNALVLARLGLLCPDWPAPR